MRGLILAVQFLTRVPTPQVRDFHPDDIGRSAAWFPFAGLLVGAAVAVPAALLAEHPLLAALVAVALWTAITGALHLDGLGDVADALGAAHRDPDRYAAVLKDPHVGTFGMVTVVLQLLAKVVLVAELCAADVAWALVLVPAWARWSSATLTRLVRPLGAGLGEGFAGHVTVVAVGLWAVALAAASALLDPVLLAGLAAPALAAAYWRRRLGGVSGDGFGATIEVTETVLLAALVAAHVVA